MSWLSSRRERKTAQAETEKRKTAIFEMALKAVEERRHAVLTVHPYAIIHITHTRNESIEFVAFDKGGNRVIAKETYQLNKEGFR